MQTHEIISYIKVITDLSKMYEILTSIVHN